MTRSLDWLSAALGDLEGQGLRRRLRHRAEPSGASVDGLLSFSTNDYLGLAGDPRLAAAAAAAANRWGAGAGASRLVTGGTELHRELETAIAAWKGAEDCVVFSSGYLANVGTIAALVSEGDAVFSDALNHASIVDGCRLSRAAVHIYPHDGIEQLDTMLAATPARRRLIVTDGVFSMDGDAADLPSLSAVARRHGAMLLVDDAHGCGVVGPDGRGTASAQGCADQVDATVGTLSKAFGSSGGYVTGSTDLCDWLRNRARGFVFDTAMAPTSAGAALAGLKIARAEPWRRERAVALAKELAAGLDAAPPAACVVPVLVGSARDAVDLQERLRADGLDVVAIRPPTVPEETARLRFSTTALHSPADVARAVAALRSRRSGGRSGD